MIPGHLKTLLLCKNKSTSIWTVKRRMTLNSLIEEVTWVSEMRAPGTVCELCNVWLIKCINGAEGKIQNFSAVDALISRLTPACFFAS